MKTLCVLALLLLSSALFGKPGIGQFACISTKVCAFTGASPITTGFIISGIGNKHILIRGVGDGLAPYFPDDRSLVMRSPKLELYNSSGLIIATSVLLGDMNATARQAVLSDGLAAGAASIMTPTDTAINIVVPPGNYTVIMTPPLSGGIGLLEVYDADLNAPSRITNISTIGPTRPDLFGGVMIVAFFATGPMKVLVRNAGPSLSQFGIANPIPDPAFTLFQGSQPFPASAGFVQTPLGVVTAAGWWNNILLGVQDRFLANAVGAFQFQDGSLDSMGSFLINQGVWSVWSLSASNPSGGISQVEIYDVSLVFPP